MDIEALIDAELESLQEMDLTPIATVSTTARESAKFAVLPRRQAFRFKAINFLVTDQAIAAKLLQRLDGKVEALLIDVEVKQAIDLFSIAQRHVSKTKLVPYKPNDATLESADLLLLHHFDGNVRDKHILIWGSGNLAGKLALRLAERGVEVTVHSRNMSKTETVVMGLNLLLPRNTPYTIKVSDNPSETENQFDAFFSFVSAERVVPAMLLKALKREALVVDGGINNLTESFLRNAAEKKLSCLRLDVRVGFAYNLLSLTDDVLDFYTNVLGERIENGCRIVAGGVIGNDGDVIVDRIDRPTQLIGIANGIGGLKHESEYTAGDYSRCEAVKKYILSRHKQAN